MGLSIAVESTLGALPGVLGIIPEGNLDTAEIRTCLKCRREFLSSWAGNRICPGCVPGNRKEYLKASVMSVAHRYGGPHDNG